MTIPHRATIPTTAASKGKFAKPPGCAGCPMEHRGVGFCPDLIQPDSHPKLAVWARDPGTSEIVKVPPEPLVGPSGFMLENWIMPRAGIKIPYSKCNTIRCHTPEDKYPTGNMRRGAEAHCRQYDRVTPENDFDFVLVTLHPAGVMHNKYDPLPLIVNDFERVKWLLDKKLSVLVLMGTEAMELWAPRLHHPVKGESHGVTDWRGHYFPTEKFWKQVNEIEDEGVKGEWTSLLFPNVRFMDLSYGSAAWQVNYLDEFKTKESLAVDLEWHPETRKLERVGLASSPENVVTFRWHEDFKDQLGEVLDSAGELVLFNGLGKDSDVDVLESVGLPILHQERIVDPHLAFHLLWPQLAGLGHLDLWTFASLTGKEPNWKICRGEPCLGACPIHYPAAYNAKDVRETWVGWQAIKPELVLRGLL